MLKTIAVSTFKKFLVTSMQTKYKIYNAEYSNYLLDNMPYFSVLLSGFYQFSYNLHVYLNK